MDSIHDLGGMQGMGPVPIHADVPYADMAAWEQRMWGLSRAGLCHGMTIDWFRHVVECMEPADYLRYSYFHKWVTTYLVLLIDNGAITLEDAQRMASDTAQAERPSTPAAVLSVDDIVAHNARMDLNFEAPAEASPRFAVGDQVTTVRHTQDGHVRLPRYARGATGQIIAYHNAHLVPEEGARGVHRGDHLYTVSFAATDLWGPGADPRDSVALELWEAYCVPA